jgi:hypothetical protein
MTHVCLQCGKVLDTAETPCRCKGEPPVRSSELVSLRLDTVRRVISLLEDIPHNCDEYTTECLKNCEACIAQHLLHELRQQANDQAYPTAATTRRGSERGQRKGRMQVTPTIRRNPRPR